MRLTSLSRRQIHCVIISAVMLLCYASIVVAQIPTVMSYDGYLTDANGKPIASGRKDFSFAIYTSPSGGSPIWTEIHEKVLVNNGTFHVVLGKGTVPKPLNLPFDQQYYLGVRVGNDPEMTPLQELMPSAYSFRAKTADNVPDASISSEKIKPNSITDDKIHSVSWNKVTGIGDGVSARVWSRQGNSKTDPNTDFLGTTDEKDLIFRTNNLQRMTLLSGGNIGIGTSTPSVKLQIQTDVNQHGFAHTDGTHNLLTWLGTAEGIEGAWIGPSFSHALSLQTANSARLTISGIGNVGIGTVNPSEKLHVVGSSLFAGDMRVNGLSTLNDATILGNLNASGNFVVSGDGQFANLNVLNNATISNKLLIQGSALGADSIALDVRAKKHGMVLSMDPGGELNSSTKFISFQVGSTVRGRIEGQSPGEYAPKYLIDAALNGAKLGALFAASPIDPGALIAQIAESGVWYVRATKGLFNVGVAFESGAGDYAEWLPRLHENEKIEPGDIVGVFGGKISRTTKGAERMMVVSSNPIVLGNMPEKEKEGVYEKVAFLGQVHVKVIGVVEEGDYIVASGRGDGCALAISPKLMTADELPGVVGRAWGSSNVTYAKLVNVAVGLGVGDMAPIVKRAENYLHDLRAKLETGSKTLSRAQDRLEQLESKVSMVNIQQEEIAQLKAAVKALQRVVQVGEFLPTQRPQILSVDAEK